MGIILTIMAWEWEQEFGTTRTITSGTETVQYRVVVRGTRAEIGIGARSVTISVTLSGLAIGKKPIKGSADVASCG